MKRKSNLYNDIISIDNLRLAHNTAKKGKSRQPGVIRHEKQAEQDYQLLYDMLFNKTYQTSVYTTFSVYEPKERLVYRLPYFPDRITHHAIMNVLKPIFVSTFTADTYSCIEGRGVHAAKDAVEKALRSKTGTKFCLKFDIKKFYPSVNHNTLKSLLRRKIKDRDFLWLLDEIIDSADGLPIGNYLSQYFANFYLTYFDHWIKEVKCVKYYFRYADDIVILSDSKEELQQLLFEIKNYLQMNLQLIVKSNYQVFPVRSRGIDFVGYVFYPAHTRIRKRIKLRFIRAVRKSGNFQKIAAFYSWLKHADTKNLQNKHLTNEQIRRFRYSRKERRIHRRKIKNDQNFERGNRGSEI